VLDPRVPVGDYSVARADELVLVHALDVARGQWRPTSARPIGEPAAVKFFCSCQFRLHHFAAGPIFLETNTLPGRTTASLYPKGLKAAGIEFADFLKGRILQRGEK
jgi:hypothetical protein